MGKFTIGKWARQLQEQRGAEYPVALPTWQIKRCQQAGQLQGIQSVNYNRTNKIFTGTELIC
ncbi:hypothetical protein [Pantoea sp. B65]|uniref:hypothetical protein n=1 Tax=Pantoea sp. B65 TaxID=2813359 RepID=UPI0039B5EFB5